VSTALHTLHPTSLCPPPSLTPSPCPPSFSFTHTPPPEIYTLSLHDALPICAAAAGLREIAALPDPVGRVLDSSVRPNAAVEDARSEEHTSELQSLTNLVCRLLLEKKKTIQMRFVVSKETQCAGHHTT